MTTIQQAAIMVYAADLASVLSPAPYGLTLTVSGTAADLVRDVQISAGAAPLARAAITPYTADGGANLESWPVLWTAVAAVDDDTALQLLLANLVAALEARLSTTVAAVKADLLADLAAQGSTIDAAIATLRGLWDSGGIHL